MFNDAYLNAAVRLTVTPTVSGIAAGDYVEFKYSGPIYKDTNIAFVAPNKLVNVTDPTGFTNDLVHLVGKQVSIEGATTGANDITKLTVASVAGGEMVITGASFSAESFASSTRLFENITKDVMVRAQWHYDATYTWLFLYELVGCGDGWTPATEQTANGYAFRAYASTDTNFRQIEPEILVDVIYSADTISLDYGTRGVEAGYEVGTDSLSARTAYDSVEDERLDAGITLGSVIIREAIMAESLEISVPLPGLQSHVATIAEDAEVTDAVTPSLMYNVSYADGAEVTDSLTGVGSYIAEIAESQATRLGYYAMIGTEPAVDGDSRVWVVNIETGASSQYDDYGFTSFFELDGSYYGVADDGIYLLDDPDADVVEAFIDFGENNCGVLGRKKILNVHVGITDGTAAYLRVTTDTGTADYALEACLRGSTAWRAKVPPSVQGTYWRMELITANAFELSGVEFVPAKLSKRL